MTNCNNLLNESIESFYGLGFILSDGCISKDRNSTRLSISINKKDKCILENLVSFLKSGNILEYKDTVSVTYYSGVKEFAEKFNINYKKNIYPLGFGIL